MSPRVTTTHCILFFASLSVNIISFGFVTWNLPRLLSKSSNPHRKRRRLLFYSLLCLCEGCWRIPTVIYFIYAIRDGSIGSIPQWTQILLGIFGPTEGFLVALAYSLYFSVFRLWWNKIRGIKDKQQEVEHLPSLSSSAENSRKNSDDLIQCSIRLTSLGGISPRATI